MMESEVTREKLEHSLKVIFDLIPRKKLLNVIGHMSLIEHFAKRGFDVLKQLRETGQLLTPEDPANNAKREEDIQREEVRLDAGELRVIPDP